MIKVAAKKKVSRFLSTCPNFQTAAHNQVCKVLAASLHKHLAAHWSLHRETPLSQTGLVLEVVPTAIVLQSGRQVSDSDTTALQMSLGRWQPDFMAISYSTKKIAIGPEVCRPSDTRAENLFEAYSRKLQIYDPVRTALRKYTASGWTVLVLPWVVGTRGFVHEQSLHDTLKFLDIPHKQWPSIVQDSVRASVEALAFMCRLRFSPSLQNRTFDTDDPQSFLTMHAADQRSGRKRKAISNEKSLISTFQRWSKIPTSNRF